MNIVQEVNEGGFVVGDELKVWASSDIDGLFWESQNGNRYTSSYNKNYDFWINNPVIILVVMATNSKEITFDVYPFQTQIESEKSFIPVPGKVIRE